MEMESWVVYATNVCRRDADVLLRTNTLEDECGGVFEQLARYTMRYQEPDLHLGLYSSESFYNFCLLYFSLLFLLYLVQV